MFSGLFHFISLLNPPSSTFYFSSETPVLSHDLSSTDTIPPSSTRAWWQLRIAQDAAAARRRKAARCPALSRMRVATPHACGRMHHKPTHLTPAASARHLREVIIAEEKERARYWIHMFQLRRSFTSRLTLGLQAHGACC